MKHAAPTGGKRMLLILPALIGFLFLTKLLIDRSETTSDEDWTPKQQTNTSGSAVTAAAQDSGKAAVLRSGK